MKVAISEITLADDINIRQGLREDAVERYAEILDELPPITLWRPNGKLLLVDGWHRIAAARRLGRTDIEAEVHEGDRTEAMVAAILANTKHGVPLSMAERNEGIVRLAQAGWRQNRIARELGLSTTRVNAILQQAEIPVPGLGVGLKDEVVKAPKEYRLPVAEAAQAGGWSQRETREVARRLSDPGVPEETKREIVSRYMEQRPDGQVGVRAELVAAVLRDASERSASPAIYGFTAAAAELLAKLAVDDEPLAGIAPDDYPDILRGLTDAERAIEQVRRLVEDAKRA
jgi:ParB-like chromosome segregation protein Spo0J